MKIHEYQAKEIFKEYKIPVPVGFMTDSKDEVVKIAEKLGLPCIVKAQVHSGARGKAGGIKIARSFEEVATIADQIIGMSITSHQTSGESKLVRKVLVEKTADIDKEFYLSLVFDRDNECITVIASPEGGMDIEEVAVKNPEAIYKEQIDLRYGLQQFNVRNILFNLKIEKENHKEFCELVENLYKIFTEKDCTLLEINPLVLTKDKKIIALDAKINFDDNALYKHPDVVSLRDFDEEDPLEVEASKYNLSYIKLDGTIGCMVNGAGLAMATMDIIKLAGADPANFLGVGGGASAEKIKNAFKLILMDKNVKAVLINIFGGILRCDILAEGIKSAIKDLKTDIPVIVRLEGTNCEEGKKILEDSELKFKVANTLEDTVLQIKNCLMGV